jgi:NADH-quinone oxidoreductase subunit L
MTLPLVLLALGALIAGASFYHLFVGGGNGTFWQTAIPQGAGGNILETLHAAPIYIVFSPLLAALIGFAIAWLFYLGNSDIPNELIRRGAWIYRFLFHKWYFDELYHFIFTRPSFALGRFFWHGVDEKTIDGIGPNGVAARVMNIARTTPMFQTGYLYHYAFLMLFGLTGMVSWLIFGESEVGATLVVLYKALAELVLGLIESFGIPDVQKLWKELF